MYTPSEILDCSNQFRRISWICLIHHMWTEGNIVLLYVKKMAEAADEGGGASRIFTRADAAGPKSTLERCARAVCLQDRGRRGAPAKLELPNLIRRILGNNAIYNV